MSMEYTTSDSEEDPDYDPKQDPDYRELTDEEETESSGDETICFQNIIDEKDKEIQELKRVINELRQILKSKINV